MYGCCGALRAIPPWGMLCGIGAVAACDSSGESTVESLSTPLESAGSGALRHALNDVSKGM